jgi:hypothetical protein
MLSLTIALSEPVHCKDQDSASPVTEILVDGGFIIPIHPEDYADAATGIGIETGAGVGFTVSNHVVFSSRFGIGYVPSGYKIEPEVLEICSDQYEFESLIFFYGMGDWRIYTVSDKSQQLRPYLLAGAGLWNARQKFVFTERDFDTDTFQCTIQEESSKKISKWSFAANGGFGLEISIDKAPFDLLIQARYLWVNKAIFENMQNIVVEMVACFRP